MDENGLCKWNSGSVTDVPVTETSEMIFIPMIFMIFLLLF